MRAFKGVWVPAELWLRKDLTVGEKMLYLEIQSLDNEFGCIAGNKKLGETIQLNPTSVSRALKSLEQKKLIKITYDDYKVFSGRKIIVTPCENDKGACENDKHSNTISNTISITTIVGYLNEKSKKQFNPKSKANASHISARLREGFKLEDFYRVIDHKSEQWLNDDKMQKYLRPETLFGNKFDGYLNEAPKKIIESNEDDYDKRARETLSPLAYEKLYGRQ